MPPFPWTWIVEHICIPGGIILLFAFAVASWLAMIYGGYGR